MSKNIKTKYKKRTYWNTETFKEEMKKKNSNIEILGKYVHSKEKILCKCLLDGYKWNVTPNSLLSGNGCPQCSGRLKKTNDIFLKEFYQKNLYANNIEILEEYINAHTKLKCKCKIDGHIWFTKPLDLLHGHGCPKCNNNAKKTKEILINELKLINQNIEIIGDYIGTHKKILAKCKTHNYKWNITPRALLSGQGCPVCAGKLVLKGINDLGTLRKDLLDYFDNVEDAYTFTVGSRKRCNVHCKNCGYKKQMIVEDLSLRGFSCPLCGDSISYPNKFSRAFLSQLPIKNFITEYSPKWANGRRYDNYFEYQGNKYILEMDGGFHYDHKSFCDLKEIQCIDKEKDFLANKQGIKVIRIECKKSNKNYIKENILKSEMKNIFNLSKINWDKCHEIACNSLIKTVCDSYNAKLGNNIELGKIYNLSPQTISHYLKIGNELNWCSYSPQNYKTNINVYIKGSLCHSYSSIRECVRGMKELYPNIFLSRNKISECCNNKRDSYKGFQFKFA